MSFSPYIAFEGNAREAMTRYATIFGAKDLQIMVFAEMPADQRPAGTDRLVMHAQFTAGSGAPFMACDLPPGMGTGGVGGSSVYHAASDAVTASRIFNALCDGGDIIMPLGPTFWSPAFGMVRDRFGTRWMISVESQI